MVDANGIHPYLQPLPAFLTARAVPPQAAAMAAYMRDQFPFLGLKAPSRRAALRDFLAAHGPPPLDDLERIVRDLWALPEREYQYVALDLLQRQRRRLPVTLLPTIEFLIVTRSWWDTVDGLASNVVGPLLERFPAERESTLARWRSSPNLWLRRTTLLFQLKSRERTDEALLFDLIRENMDSSEFFIQKAIGWALREYSKSDAEAVRRFVRAHPLAPLSRREALKWLERQGGRDEGGGRGRAGAAG